MVNDINDELIRRQGMDTGEELRYLARRSVNTNINRLGFLEHAYHEFLQQNKTNNINTGFSELLDANLKTGKRRPATVPTFVLIYVKRQKVVGWPWGLHLSGFSFELNVEFKKFMKIIYLELIYLGMICYLFGIILISFN